MSRFTWLAVPALVALSAIVKLVVEKEYSYWSRHVAEWLVRAAPLLLPRSCRQRYATEWRHELSEAVREGGTLSYACAVLVISAPLITIQRAWLHIGSVLRGLRGLLREVQGVDFCGAYLMKRTWGWTVPTGRPDADPSRPMTGEATWSNKNARISLRDGAR